MRRHNANLGFTFIEVLIAMAIFTMIVASAVTLIRGAVKSTQDTRDVTMATWLLKAKMVELETGLETGGFEKACDKEKKGKFDAPNDRFAWRTTCKEIHVRLPTTSDTGTEEDKEDDKVTSENQIQKMIMQSASEYLSNSLREIHAEVTWQVGKTKRIITATTEYARYDEPFNMPALNALAGSGTSGTPATPTPTPKPGGGS